MATQTTFTHTLHFTGYEAMGYAVSHLDCFVQPASLTEKEFDGDKPNEVVFTTSKQLPQTTIKKILAGLNPKDHTFNQ